MWNTIVQQGLLFPQGPQQCTRGTAILAALGIICGSICLILAPRIGFLVFFPIILCYFLDGAETVLIHVVTT